MNKPKKQSKLITTTNKIVKSVSDVLNGNFLAKENVVSSLPFMFFITFLILCYIANGYYSENSIRQLNRIDYDLKELRSEYISTKSDMMHKSKQSEVAKLVKKLELKESVSPPKKIVVQENE